MDCTDNDEAYDNPNNSQMETTTKRKIMVAPWKYVEDFHQVYDWLFAPTSTEETRLRALDEMRVWSLRRGNLCPAAILATTVLLEVQLKDVIPVDGSKSRLTQDELQCLYAYAFTRFFNYMSSIMQTHNMRTMYETAHQLGLPSFVVDLRHLCTHGQVLVPLEVLRPTSKLCYAWIRDYYWSKLRVSMRNVDASEIRYKNKTPFEGNVTHLFRVYDAALEGYCKGAQNLKTAKRHLHGKRFVQLKEFMNQKQLILLRETFDTIVKELTILFKNEQGTKGVTSIFIAALLESMNYFFVLAEKYTSSTEELQPLIYITRSLFRLMATQGFIDKLFVNLLKIAECNIEPTERRVGAGFWALQIVKGFVAFRKCKQLHKVQLDENPKMKQCDFSTFNCDIISNQVRKLLVYSGIDIKNTLLFGRSIRNPGVWVFERKYLEYRFAKINIYTAPVVKSLLILADPSLTPDKIKAMEELIDIYCGPNFEKSNEETSKLNPESNSIPQTNEKIYTADDLFKILKDNKIMDVDDSDNEETSAGEVEQYGIWTRVPTDGIYDWSTCPFGRLPWE